MEDENNLGEQVIVLDDDNNLENLNETNEQQLQQQVRSRSLFGGCFYGGDQAALGASVLINSNVMMKVFQQDYDEKMYSKYGQLHRTLASTYYRMSQMFRLRAVADFLQGSRKVGQGSVWLMGVCYPETEEEGLEQTENGKKGKKTVYLPDQVLAELQSDFESRIWITYRRDFDPIGDKKFTTDVGWGCTLRSGQMMLAQALQNHFFGRSWRHVEQQDESVQVLNWFRDEPDCPFSIHKFIEYGGRHGVVAGQWLGPYVVSRTLQTMVNEQIQDHVHCHVLCDSGGGAPTLDGSEISKIFDENKQKGEGDLGRRIGGGIQDRRNKGLILLVPLVLGVNSMNECYHSQLLSLFTYPQSIGVLGGRPSSSLYFVGCQHHSLLYLDPHASQPVVRDGDMSSYHCGVMRHMDVTSMDSSLALGFYCANKQEFEDLCGRLLELEMSCKHAPLITQTALNQLENQRKQIQERFPDETQISYVDEDDQDWEVVM
eukprot:TRINITY_DN10569_c1_g1_i1.p1 TRINITY_DN10569_c1_g1~~TRINITY_DN10569_c1_g1_i1.p1  ORF type:complete len:487 (-),score=82.37 TRINITY_DN10569_c1_g1_i1:248-1708(-)